MKKTLSGFVVATVLLFTSRVATAHPGHGVTESRPDSFVHYLIEPIHLPSAFVVGMLVVAIVALARNRTSRSR